MSRSVFTVEYQLQSGYIALSANKRTDLMKCSLVSNRDNDLNLILLELFIVTNNKSMFLGKKSFLYKYY